MRCVQQTEYVCTNYEKCKNAVICANVPKGIKKDLQSKYTGRKVFKQTYIYEND